LNLLPDFYSLQRQQIAPKRGTGSVMDEAEFDRFAEEYRSIHEANIRTSGEGPEFFAEYKVADVARLLSGNARNILDFGAGVGTSLPYFRKYFPHSHVTCLDVSSKSLEVGRSRFPGQADFVHFDGTRIPFPDGHFDLVFLACVMHHIPHSEHVAILKDARRVLRPEGSLVVFEHNPFNPLTVRAVNTCEFDVNAVLLRPGALRRNALKAGFADASICYRIFFPGQLRALRVIEPWMTWIPLGAQYYLHGRGNAGAP
jgi:SAM-dependent methyltransferase